MKCLYIKKIKDEGYDSFLWSKIAPNDGGPIAERSYHDERIYKKNIYKFLIK